jgi:polynucleotide 5'-kinase involved in rRNA processing
MIEVAHHLEQIKPSISVRISQIAHTLKHQGIDIIDLSIGQPDWFMPDAIRKGIIHAMEPAKEPLGEVFREGTLYTQETIEVYDHEFHNLAEGVAIPHIVFDDYLGQWNYVASHENASVD